MMFKRLLMVLIDDIRQSDERMRYVCVQICPPFWLFPGGTRNSEIICFCVLLQTIWSNGHGWPNDPKTNE